MGWLEGHALSFHLFHALIDQLLLELEVGNTVTKQATNTIVFLVNRDVMSSTRKLLSTGETGGTRSHNRYTFACSGLWRLGRYPPFGPGFVDNCVLNGFDSNSVIVNVQRTSGFTRSRTNSPGELRKIIGRVQYINRPTPVLVINQIVPVGDDVVDGAPVVTKGDATVHATSGLFARLFI